MYYKKSIRERTQTRDMGYIIKRTKFKFAGHTMREPDDKLAKIVTEWRPEQQTS